MKRKKWNDLNDFEKIHIILSYGLILVIVVPVSIVLSLIGNILDFDIIGRVGIFLLTCAISLSLATAIREKAERDVGMR